MAEVVPITSESDITAIHRKLTRYGYVREAEAFIIGCNVGLRINDLLQITFDDVKRGTIFITEKKTGKKREIPCNGIIEECAAVLEEWFLVKKPNLQPTYLFQAIGNRVSKTVKPVTYHFIGDRVKEAAKAVGIDGNVNTHSMRKTFGYMHYKNTKDLTQIQKLFGHATQAETLAYIGVTKETQKNLYLTSNFAQRS